MKKIQTVNHKKTTIGNGKRTVGLTSQPRIAKQRTMKRTVKRNTISASKPIASKPITRRAATKSTGCSGCSRNKK
jgi:hypothetical protein